MHVFGASDCREAACQHPQNIPVSYFLPCQRHAPDMNQPCPVQGGYVAAVAEAEGGGGAGILGKSSVMPQEKASG